MNITLLSHQVQGNTYHRRSGFTIVELLIVIVVIAILAAITIVSYNGINKRAKQTANFSAIDSYVKSFALIKAGTGGLPTGKDNNASCLGPDPKPTTCEMDGQKSITTTATAATKAKLAEYGMTAQPAVGIGMGDGHLVYTESYYGEPALLWTVPADQDCVPSARRFYDSASRAWTNGLTRSGRSASTTTCYLSLAS